MRKNIVYFNNEIGNTIGFKEFFIYAILNDENKMHECDNLCVSYDFIEEVKITIKPVGKTLGKYSQNVYLYKNKNSFKASDIDILRIEKTIKIHKALWKYEEFEITMKINGKTIKAESLNNKWQYCIRYESDYPYGNANIYLNLEK